MTVETSSASVAVANAAAEWYEPMIESSYMPDFLLRRGIRLLLSQRERSLYAPADSVHQKDPSKQLWSIGTLKPKHEQQHPIPSGNGRVEQEQERKMQFIEQLRNQAIAVHTDKANEQHYEVPTEFLQLCLGERMKYSSCLYPPSDDGSADHSLNAAEELMLQSYVDKAQLRDGMTVLDLGCGWGSLSLFLAERFPRSRITGLSNSATQKAHIDATAKRRGLRNLTIITGDVQLFQTAERFDRILSIEMLEHMKNYPQLFAKISSWLNGPEALFFCHVFSHRSMPYHFETEESGSWMARHFFTGGTMPSHDLFLYFQDHLTVRDHWFVNGNHYAKTSLHWLENLDRNRVKALQILEESIGKSASHKHLASLNERQSEASRMLQRWRIFFIAVEELFGWKQGEEWGVTHYLFSPKHL